VFSPDISFGARRRGSFANRHGPTIIHGNRFSVTRSSTVTVNSYCSFYEVMAGTRKRTIASCSSISQALGSKIQILQSRTVLILEPMNPNGDVIILDVMVDACATATLNTTTLPPPHSHAEGVPPPPPSPYVPPPL